MNFITTKSLEHIFYFDILFIPLITLNCVKLGRPVTFIKYLDSSLFNPLSTNPTKWSNILKQLLECVWPFCGIVAERVNMSTKNFNLE